LPSASGFAVRSGCPDDFALGFDARFQECRANSLQRDISIRTVNERMEFAHQMNRMFAACDLEVGNVNRTSRLDAL